MRQEVDLRAFIQNGHGRTLYGGVRCVLEIGQRVIQPPAQRAGQDQRPEAVRQRVCDGVAGVRVVLLRDQTLHGYARRDCTGIRVEVADEQIRHQTEPFTVGVAPVAGNDKIARLLLRRGAENAAGDRIGLRTLPDGGVRGRTGAGAAGRHV